MLTLKYIISFAGILLLLPIYSQTTSEPEEKTRPKYVVPEGRETYLRISIDPTRYLYPLIDGITRGGFEVSVDTEFKGRYFPVFEIGNEYVNLKKINYQLGGNGMFIRLGIDNNFLKYQDKFDRDMFFMGIRLAYAYLNQDAENIIVNNTGTDQTFNYPNLGFNTFWGEITLGIKTEIAKNLFLGWTVRGKRRFSVTEREVPPYLIPGYGKYANSFNVAANLYLSYTFTLKHHTKSDE